MQQFNVFGRRRLNRRKELNRGSARCVLGNCRLKESLIHPAFGAAVGGVGK